MPAPSKVDLLPEAIREQLNQRLIQQGFGGYVALSEWLLSQGYEIKKSALHRYGQKFEERVEQLKIATAQVKAMAKELPDDDGATNAMLMRLTQEKLFKVLVEGEIDPSEPINLPKLTRAIADLNRSDVTLRKWQAEAKEKARQVADEVAAEMRKSGGTGGVVSDATVEEFRKRILGIAA